MIALFYKKNPYTPFLLLIFAVVVKLPLFLAPVLPIQEKNQGLLFEYFTKWIIAQTSIAPLIFSLLSFLILFAQAIYLNYFFNRHRMTSRPTDLPGMAYLLGTSLLPTWSVWSAPLLINLLILFLLAHLFESYSLSDIRKPLFNRGLAIGLGLFIYPPSLWLALWFVFSLLIIRPVKIQEILIALLGLLTPIYFLLIGLFWTDQWGQLANYFIVPFAFPATVPPVWFGGLLFILFIPFLVGFYHVQDQVRKMLIQVRRGWTVFFMLLLIGFFIPLFSADPYTGWIILLIPLSAYHASFYYYTSFRIFPLLFFWISFLFVLLNQYTGSGGKVIFDP
ncbi:hypothetical protein LBMAG22_03750 [Bacteroidota bacterium]|nr:hypothetical protein LBMAG22_03750 [Bacteroidota bacterium]